MESIVKSARQRIEDIQATIEQINSENAAVLNNIEELKKSKDLELERMDAVLAAKIDCEIAALREKFVADCDEAVRVKRIANAECVSTLMKHHSEELSRKMALKRRQYDEAIEKEFESRKLRFQELLNFKRDEALAAAEAVHTERLNTIADSYLNRVRRLESL